MTDGIRTEVVSGDLQEGDSVAVPQGTGRNALPRRPIAFPDGEDAARPEVER